MHRIFRAVIFDLDGLLADSEPWWNQIDAKLLAEYGVMHVKLYEDIARHGHIATTYAYPVSVADRYVMDPSPTPKNAFHISAPVEELMRRRGEIATEFFANRVGLFPSAKVTLERLREMKLYLALATSSVSASARPFLERTGIRRLLDVIITGDEVERGKPHPDIYLITAEKLQVDIDSCLVIEDALAGIAAAKAANMRVAAIPDTRFVDPREYTKEADYVLRDLSEIPALIRRVGATE